MRDFIEIAEVQLNSDEFAPPIMAEISPLACKELTVFLTHVEQAVHNVITVCCRVLFFVYDIYVYIVYIYIHTIQV